MATFVLVHGAWHGAWCWKKTIENLKRNGQTALAFDLPGHGEDPASASEVTLNDYVDRIVGVLDSLSDKVILVGHSMGGIPVTAAAEERPDKLSLLVYVTAFLPAPGQGLLDIESMNPISTVPPSIIPSADEKTATIAEEKLAELFYHDCSDEDIAFAKAHVCPQPLQPLQAKVDSTPERFGSVPRAYIECTDDHAISLALQRLMQEATPCAFTASLPTSHSPFLSAPERLAAELVNLSHRIESGTG